MPTPQDIFWSPHYRQHNESRQDHLASLDLDLADQTVLEVGAGIGDHTSFFLERGSQVIVTEPREENLAILRHRYPDLEVWRLDLDDPPPEPIKADIVYCYGTLYHLGNPAEAIRWLGRCTRRLLLLETCVSAGNGAVLHPFEEDNSHPDNAVRGHGCRPTREWIRRALASEFEHVYATVTQPRHPEFPLDWSLPELAERPLIRAVFIASRSPLDNPLLTKTLPMRHSTRDGDR